MGVQKLILDGNIEKRADPEPLCDCGRCCCCGWYGELAGLDSYVETERVDGYPIASYQVFECPECMEPSSIEPEMSDNQACLWNEWYARNKKERHEIR